MEKKKKNIYKMENKQAIKFSKVLSNFHSKTSIMWCLRFRITIIFVHCTFFSPFIQQFVPYTFSLLARSYYYQYLISRLELQPFISSSFYNNISQLMVNLPLAIVARAPYTFNASNFQSKSRNELKKKTQIKYTCEFCLFFVLK